MWRYFVFVFLTNITAVFVYQRVKKIDLTKALIIYIGAFSLLMSLMYPFLLRWLNVFQVGFLYAFAALFVGIVLANLDSQSLAALERQLDKLRFKAGPLDFVKAAQKRFAEFKFIPQKVAKPSELTERKIPEQQFQVELQEEPSELKFAELEVAAALLDDEIEIDLRKEETGDKLNDINFYIDKGFEAKSSRNIEQALSYFRQAVGLSPPNDLMTLLVFDINSMCKELGRYQEAKEVLNLFLETRGHEFGDSLRRDITTSIEYLNILQDLLQETNTPNLPITSLPSSIREAAGTRLAEQAN